ncbi:MAG: dihydropteroate synthase, partial [Chitinophagales bacterium]
MAAKNTIFSSKTTLNCRGRLLDLSIPVVMGIINVTPDSFYDGGKWEEEKTLLMRAEKMLREGASILDVGGMSTKPGAVTVSEEEELRRVIPVIHAIIKQFPEAIISVDTWRSCVLRRAVEQGASIANDISGGALDVDLWKTVADLKLPYILMHMQGSPDNMQLNPQYENAVQEIFDWLKIKILQLNELGIHDIVIDPGFGFGKSVDHNFQLLRELSAFRLFELPILAGVSRKSMICKVLKVNPDQALNGTSVLNTIALLNGASILRVHDVREAKEAIQLMLQLHAAA